MSPSIVLVHGGFVDGAGWRGVYDALRGDGYAVRIVQNPTKSLADDAAITRDVLDSVDEPVLLVGHSYGGAVITEAGTHTRSPRSSTSPPSRPIRASPSTPCSAHSPPTDPSRRSSLRSTATSSWTEVSSATPSPPTSPPTKRPSWPTRRCRGAWTPSVV